MSPHSTATRSPSESKNTPCRLSECRAQVLVAVNDSEAAESKAASGSHWSTLAVFCGPMWCRTLQSEGIAAAGLKDSDVCAVHCDSHSSCNAAAAARIAAGLQHLLCPNGAVEVAAR